jgi:cell division protein FtsW (lipid II flippase)
VDSETISYRRRSLAQLALTLLGQSIGFAGYLLTGLFRDNALPSDWLTVAIVWYGLGLALNLLTRLALPYVDPVLLPLALTLSGLGLAMLHRLDLAAKPASWSMLDLQFIAMVVGLLALAVIVVLIKDPRRLRGYPMILSLAGLILLILPLIPGLGMARNGSRIWIHLGPISFQPAEIAKIVLAASFAAYLASRQVVLASAGRRIVGLELPRLRDFLPILLLWLVALAIMVFENDFGTALLFFGMFVMMIYVTAGKISWVIIGLLAFAAAAVLAARFTGHVQTRVDYWLHPFDQPDNAYQIIQAQFALSHGGLFGSGWGLGQPQVTIYAASDMISAAIGEEIGVVGLIGVIALYGLLVFRGLKTALISADAFPKLFAAGLSFGLMLQVFTIIGGVTRLLPLTGLTTPFLSQGGSSMVANWILVAALLIISNQARRPRQLDPEAGQLAALTDEATQVISASELAKVGRGRIRRVAARPDGQVRLDAHGLAPLPIPPDPLAATDWAGSEPTTVLADPTPSPSPGRSADGEATLEVTQAFDPFGPATSVPPTQSAGSTPPRPGSIQPESAEPQSAAGPGFATAVQMPATAATPAPRPPAPTPAPVAPPSQAPAPVRNPAAPAASRPPAPPTADAASYRPRPTDAFDDDDDLFGRGSD